MDFYFSWIKSWILDSVNCSGDTVGNSNQSLATYCTLSTHMNGFHFPVYFEKMHEFVFLIMKAVEDFNSLLTGGNRNKLSNDIQVHAQLLPWLLDELDNEGADMLLLYLGSLFKHKDIQIPMFLYIFSALCLILGPSKSHVAFLRELQKVYDSIKSSEEILLLQKTFLSHALSSFGLDCFLSIFVGVVLDLLMTHQMELIPLKGFNKCPLPCTTLPKELRLKHDSLMPYKTSPNFDGDADSISSYNLDDFFQENHNDEKLLTLSKEYTSNITNVLYRGFNGGLIINNVHRIIPPSPEKPPNFIYSQNEPSCQVSSLISQEINFSSSGTIIPINTTNELLPSFEVPLSNFNKNDEATSDIICDNHNRYSDFECLSDKINSPFLVLSGEKEVNSQYLQEGILENVPQDEELLVQEATNLLETSNIGICQTIVDSVKWLLPWLGPIVSTEFVALPLLKNMSKVLLDYDMNTDGAESIDLLIDKVSPMIDCLIEIVLIYGDNIVFYLYLPTISKSVS